MSLWIGIMNSDHFETDSDAIEEEIEKAIELAYTLNFVMNSRQVLWFSGHGLWLLHRRSRFNSHSRWFTWQFVTWQVNEPSPGSTHALWGKLGCHSKVTVDLHSLCNYKMGLLASWNSTIYIELTTPISRHFHTFPKVCKCAFTKSAILSKSVIERLNFRS